MTFHGPGIKKYSRISIRSDDGRMQSGYRAVCATEGCENHLDIRATTGSLAVEVIERKIRAVGWAVGTKFCYCPKHAKRSIFLDAGRPMGQHPVEPAAELTGKEPDMKVDTEREPTRDQKRSILREIDGNWDDQARRYMGVISDQSIAAKLGVPRNWVENCRIEFYGDTGKNEEFDKLLGQAKNAVAASRKLEEEAMTLAGKLENQRSIIEALINKMEKMS